MSLTNPLPYSRCHCEECNDAAIPPFLSQRRDRRASLAMTNKESVFAEGLSLSLRGV